MTAESTNEEKRSRFGRIARWTAGVLALMMLLSALQLTRIVKPAEETDDAKAAEKAFASLAADDRYLNAPALERVGMLLSAIGKRERDYAYYLELASVYAGRGEYLEAAELFRSAAEAVPAEDTPLRAQCLLKTGSAYVLGKAYPEAKVQYEQALRLDPSLSLARILLAQTCIELGENTAAEQHLAAYLEQAPNDVDSRRVLGSLMELRQDYAMAYRQYLRVFSETQSDTDRFALARAELMTERYADAAANLDVYLEHQNDTDGTVHYLRAVSFLGMGRFADAEAELLKTLENGYAERGECYQQLTACAYEQGNYADALEYGALAARMLGTPDAACLQRMGIAALQLQKYADAARYLQQSVNDDTSLVENYFLLGTAHLLNGAYDAAAEAFTRSIDQNTRVCESHYQRGVCLLQLERYEEGLLDLVQAANDDSDPETQEAALALLSELGVTIAEETAE